MTAKNMAMRQAFEEGTHLMKPTNRQKKKGLSAAMT